MSVAMKTLERAKKRVFSFDKMVSSWKNDHEEARSQDPRRFGLQLSRMELHEVEMLLTGAISLWHDTETLHADWIEAVLEGSVEPSLDIDKRIYRLYDRYHEVSGKLNSMLEVLEYSDIVFEKTQEFRDCFSESKEAIARISEPSTPIAPIPAKAGALLQASVDHSRYE